jgi:hypothetical protein
MTSCFLVHLLVLSNNNKGIEEYSATSGGASAGRECGASTRKYKEIGLFSKSQGGPVTQLTPPMSTTYQAPYAQDYQQAEPNNFF